MSAMETSLARSDPRVELSVVVPMFNEADNIPNLLARLTPVLERNCSSHEIVFVDDGSRDDTMTALRAAHAADPRVTCISFSRNFGKEIAIAAGLDNAEGAAVIIMDADLQHPPEVIESFIEKWREGYQNVYGQRTARNTDSRLRRAFTKRFYKLFAALGETSLPEGAGDFRLLDRVAVLSLRAMGERARFSKGLYAWIGFKSVGVPFDVAEREAGQSKFSYRKLTRFALDGLMSFTTLPLMVWTYIGTLVSVFALAMAIAFVLKTFIYGVDLPGFASIIVSVMFLGGVQLLSLGVLGEYIGRIFAEVKRRPLYLVGDRIGHENEATSDPAPRGHPRRV
jgi:glycosyltransferase involved in cell wall biosynthesis